MVIFVCAGCGAELTTPLSRVSLPVHARQKYGNGVQLPVLMESGTFAVDPDPWEGPRRMGDGVDPGGAETRGGRAPVHAVSAGTSGASVIAPGDIRGTRLIPEKRGGACCGLDGADGPNMACERCGLPVATRVDDCSLWQAVWLSSDVVRRVPVDGVHTAPLLSWAEVTEKGEKMSPVEPIATWGGRLGSNHYWSWSPRWEAAAGHALAHLLVASQGQPVAVPGGLTTDVFQRALDALLPTDGPKRRAVLAGPGQPSPDAGVDILLVPVHPQTGQTWTPETPTASAHLVPLPLGVWLWLVSPQPYPPVPASGRLPRDVLRDDPLPLLPSRPFRADRGTFQRTLARLPAARGPRLRAILGNLGRNTSAGFF
ncbi:hypothetical protein ABZ599_23790 [Streptomyces misionensis]|uniref:hypothetical protein n=1 Tax=Streptomyces misionensis TaxID=67331 RepID=UPI0033D74A70